MQGLLADTDEVTAHPAVDDPLLGDDVEIPVHLENTHARGDDDGLLPRPVQVPVYEMLLESVEGDVEDLQEVSPGCSGQSRLGRSQPWPLMVFENKLNMTLTTNSKLIMIVTLE